MAETRYTGSDASSRYQRYRPKWYNPRMSIFWWIRKKPYVHFIVRELTSVFVAAYAVVLIFQLWALGQGPEAYEAIVSFFETPFSITLHAVILLAVIFHSITWFKLAPTAMVLKLGKKRIPGSLIITANFLMWIVLSVAMVLLIVAV